MRQFLIGGALLGAAWWFHSHFLVPLQQREVGCLQKLAEVRQRIGEAKARIDEIGKQESATASARDLLDSLKGNFPKEPTVVWLPLRLKTHLRGAGITEVGIRVNSALPEPGAPGFERSFWNLNIPRQEGMQTMNGLLLALKEIERQESFVRILDLSFVADSAPPHWPAGGLNVTALVPK